MVRVGHGSGLTRIGLYLGCVLDGVLGFHRHVH